jgi:predicted RNA binding protein YcfA (HicA-like mRNA interferase family)
VTSRLPVISGKEMTRALRHVGFDQVGQHGSHLQLRHPDGRVAIVPLHKTLAAGTLRSVLRQSRLTVDELRVLL